MEKRKVENKYRIVITYVSLIFLVLTLFISIFVIDNNKKSFERDTTVVLNDGWRVNGEEEDDISSISVTLKPGEKISLSRIIDSSLYKNNHLIFYCGEMGIETFVGDKQIYSLNRTNLSDRILIKSNIVIELTGICVGDEIILNIFNVSEREMDYEIPYMRMGTFDAIEREIYGQEWVTIICFVLMVAVLIVFITFIFYASRTKKTMERRFIPFGLFVLVTCIWLFTDSTIINLYPINIELVSLISIFAFKFLPLGIIYFMQLSFIERITSFRIMLYLVYLNIVLGIINCIGGFYSLNYGIFVDQLLLISSLIVCVIYTIKYIKKYDNDFQQKLLLFAFSIFLVTSLSSFICYYVYSSDLYHIIISIGTVCFFVCVFAILVYFSHLDSKSRKAIAMERNLFRKLSYKDELTGLGNKREFEEDMENYTNIYDKNDLSLIYIDINDIKRINDTYGHGAGNILISQCAECIMKAFNDEGKCYRIGGDEFAVVLNKQIDIEHAITHLKELIKVSNGERIYKLSVSIGYACMDEKDVNTIEELRFNADLSMYKDKTKMKIKDNERKNEIWQKMIDTIISIFEVKDPYTAQHSNRVSYIAKFIGESMNFTELVVQDIFLAGKFHDIGKIGISDRILTKKSRLNDEEFLEIKKHTVIGEKIINSAGGMDHIAKIIRHHHEKYNGAGYPDGIKEDDIPIESRVLALADSIDAMASDRCYRKALSYDECKEEIKNKLGVFYDPIIGQCVLDNWDELISIHKDLKKQLN